jgi:hypothetical protein
MGMKSKLDLLYLLNEIRFDIFIVTFLSHSVIDFNLFNINQTSDKC